ncbi:formimidoylglutamase [Flavobacterium sp. NRK F10]|uniref:formimidoylglutamase n=1 Tax=Flavobacterium sp. NRK F10 TaxID=2954931 RepID=UPI002091838C|nr:formimidoylglutamase [Flavobacterium sp. NRK F10]MCO6176138.1 formimidoylglutamase [Flavobacterium sp. NRK F10]
MENIKLLTSQELAKITHHRSGEIKFGERIQVVPENTDILDFIKNSTASFVLLGLPEDIGVKANFGRTGTASAYENTLKSLVNIQHNKFCKGSDLLILGALNLDQEMQEAQNLSIYSKEEKKRLFQLVEKIDKEVSHIIHQIINTGKTPIIIGGGHNNAYGNIKGLALAKGKPVNAINFDAHTDFRVLEGRHSGNGFSYAFEEGFLKNYFVFGLHENFVSKSVFNTLKELNERVRYVTYEEIEVKRVKEFNSQMAEALNFIKNDPFGIELDLDAIPGIYSSAMTLSGFSVQQAREYVYYFGNHKNASYLHICEGAPDLDHTNNSHLTGKLIAYLVTDFMKSKM